MKQFIVDEKRLFDKIASKNLKTELSFNFYLPFYNVSGIDYIKPNSKSLLEIGCGEGTHCFNFIKLGYAVTGIDISEKAVGKAKNKIHIDIKNKVSF